ncbi:MAG: hypothetical protein U1F11_00475 [Steroidobacteraceae bacterium]
MVIVTSCPGRIAVVPERNSTFCVMKAVSVFFTPTRISWVSGPSVIWKV